MLKGEFELPELPTEEPKEVETKGGKKWLGTNVGFVKKV
jgi:hypothetical protein